MTACCSSAVTVRGVLGPAAIVGVSGFIEIGLAFWASGEFGNKAVLLITWIGLFALFRGIESFISAFQLRSLRKRLTHA